MPIGNRVDMLTTGVRTPVGVKVLGADLNKIQEIGEEIEHTLAQVPGTRSVYAERVSGGLHCRRGGPRQWRAVGELGQWLLSVGNDVSLRIGQSARVSRTVGGKISAPGAPFAPA